MSVMVDLTERERELLMELFRAAERELILGIDRADVRDFRDELKSKFDTLERLKDKIENARQNAA